MNAQQTPREARPVTIVLRTKDRPELFARAIDDVLAQTSTGWNLLVINDGGDHAPVEATIEARSNRFPVAPDVIRIEHSVGRDGILNVALERVKSDYIAIHDDDDTWAPEFVEQTVAWLDARPDAGAVAVSTEIVLERITDQGIVELSRSPISIPHDTLSLFDLVLGNRIPPIGMVFRRTTAVSVGGFDESLSVLGDWDFTLRVATRTPVGYIAGPALAFWHQRPGSVGAAANSVHGELQLHMQTDRLLRDRALRAYIADHGVGGLLFISRFVDERVAATEDALTQRISAAEHAISERISAGEQAAAEAAVDRAQDTLESQLARIDDIVHRHVQYHSVVATVRRFAQRAVRPVRRR